MPAVSDKDRKMTEASGGSPKAPYRGDQGRLARLAVFWSLAVLLFYGCVSLYRTLSAAFGGTLGKPFSADLRSIPVLGLPVNPALLITAVVLAGVWFLLYRWQQTPKVADLLIETESELRKVTWPTVPEAVNSSIVVMVCVLFLMMFLAAADYFLGQWTTIILTGGNG
jgi:preprotein translocase SecE subunit